MADRPKLQLKPEDAARPKLKLKAEDAAPRPQLKLKPEDEGLWEDTKDFAASATASVRDMVPLGGVADRLAAGAYATAGEGVDAIRSLVGSDKPQRDWVDRYHGVLRDEEKAIKEAKERSLAGEIVGTGVGALTGLAMPSPDKYVQMGKSAAALSNLGANVVESFVDQGTRNPEKTFDLDAATDAATMSGGIGATLSAIPYVGKLVPGTKNSAQWVNDAMAWLAAKNPMSKVTKEELQKLINNPELRNQARNAVDAKEIGKVREQLEDVGPKLKNAVGSKFKELEEQGLEAIDDTDAQKLTDLDNALFGQQSKIQEFPDHYPKSADDRMTKIFKALDGESPRNYGTDLAGKKLDEVPIPEAKRRVLEARRDLDATKFDAEGRPVKMSKYEQEAADDTRALINDYLHNKASGGAARKEADELYTQFSNKSKDLFGSLQSKAAGNVKEFDEKKLHSVLKNRTGAGEKFERKLQAMQEWVTKAEPKIGKLPEVQDAMKALTDLRSKVDMNKLIDAADRIGGPSGTAGRVLMHLMTGGTSALLLPVSDPGMWLRIVDSLGPAGRAVQKAADAIAKTDPALVTRIYMANREQEPVK